MHTLREPVSFRPVRVHWAQLNAGLGVGKRSCSQERPLQGPEGREKGKLLECWVE